MATELRDLTIEEVSLVDAPANKGARVVLMKRDGKGGIMEPNTEERASLLKRLAQYLGVETVTPAENEEGAGDMADEALKKQVDELTKQLDEVTKALAAEKAAREKAEKSVEDAAKAVEKSAKYQEFRSKMSPALQKAMDEMDEKEREEFMSRFGKAEDPVAKALAVEAKKAADAIAERDARIAKLESADRIAKRREELKDLAGVEKFNEFVEAIDAVYLKDAAAADEIVKRLKALAAQAKAGDLFKVAGRDGEGTGDAETGIKAAVAKVMAAEPELTREQAVEKALKANPALYDAYLAEQSKE